MSYIEFVKEYKVKAKELLKQELLDLINKNVWEGIIVNGWTPYFNDGDVCSFSVYSCGPLNKDGEDEKDIDLYEDWNSSIGDLVQADTEITLELFEGEGRMVMYKCGTTTVDYIEHD